MLSFLSFWVKFCRHLIQGRYFKSFCFEHGFINICLIDLLKIAITISYKPVWCKAVYQCNVHCCLVFLSHRLVQLWIERPKAWICRKHPTAWFKNYLSVFYHCHIFHDLLFCPWIFICQLIFVHIEWKAHA